MGAELFIIHTTAAILAALLGMVPALALPAVASCFAVSQPASSAVRLVSAQNPTPGDPGRPQANGQRQKSEREERVRLIRGSPFGFFRPNWVNGSEAA